MTAPRSIVLLLVAGLVLLAGSAYAQPVETPPEAPPAGAPTEAPEGTPPGAPAEAAPTSAPDEVAPTGELPPLEEAAGLDLSNAAPGHMPSTHGPALPSVIGRNGREASQILGQWRLREESVVTAPQYVGRIVDQHPDAGTTLAPGEVVTLVVGVPHMPARDYRSVPRIESLKALDAVNLLKKDGFDVMLRVAESYDSEVGTVIAQAPRPMSIDRLGAKVVVVVGKGGIPDPVEPAEEPATAPLPPPCAPAPAAPPAIVDESAPPAGAPAVPEGPPPGMTETPPPATPAQPPRVQPPAEPPPTGPVPPTQPAEEPTPPAPPSEAPPTEPGGAQPSLPEPPPAVVPEPETPPPPPMKPAAPALVSPAAGQSYPRAFGSTFTWKPVPGATGYEWELQVEAKDGSWSQVSSEVVEDTHYRPKRMEEGRYRWRVRALTEGVEGEWSPFLRLFMYGP